MKRITVKIIAQIVNSDGYPAGFDGEEFSKGHEENLEIGKFRRSPNDFCPKDVKAGARNGLYRYGANGVRVTKCRCHGKHRLTTRTRYAL